MNRLQINLLALGIVVGLQPAFAKALYFGKTEMIQKAEAIVVARIIKVESAHKKGKLWTYGQRATAMVDRTLKGPAAGMIDIYGMESFLCARCRYKTGRFLLFLAKDEEDFWHGVNWQLGIRPVKGDRVEWFKDGKSLFEMTPQPLPVVLKEIESVLKQDPAQTRPEPTP